MVKNIKRIVYLITVLIIIAIIKPITSKALTYVELYNGDRYFKESGDNPLNRSEFLAYKSGKQKAIEIPTWPGTKSDWGYVEKNPGIWCLNHVANKTGGNLYIQDILTITGNSVNSDRYKDKRKNRTDDPYDAAMFAYAITYEPNTRAGFKG